MYLIYNIQHGSAAQETPTHICRLHLLNLRIGYHLARIKSYGHHFQSLHNKGKLECVIEVTNPDIIIGAETWRSKSVVLLLLTFCLLLLPLWESVIVLCFVVRYFMSILVLQSS